MKVRFSPRAVAELEAIADYLTPRSRQGAQNVRAAILNSLENLALFPGIGRRQTVEGVYKIGVRKNPYLIYYRIDDDAQEIAYRPLMKALLDIGYKGYVGQEFIPTRDAFAGLQQAVALCDV